MWETPLTFLWIPSVGRENSDNIGGLVNKTIIAAYRIEDPYVMLKRGKTGEKLTGYFVDFWMRVQKKLKFKTKFVAMDMDQARYRLAMADVDVLLLPVVETIENHDDFEFTLPVASHWYTLFLRRARVSIAPDAHVQAIGYNMILLTIAALLLLVFSLWCSEVIGACLKKECLKERRQFYEAYKKRSVPYRAKNADTSWRRFLRCITMVSPGNCFLCVLSLLCLQNWYGVSKRLPTRILLISAFIFGFLLMNAYSAVLMSYVAAGSRDVPYLAHLEEIAAHGGYVVCVRKQSYAYSTFFEPTDGQVRQIWRNVLNGPPCPRNPETTEELLQTLCKGEGTVWSRYTDTDPRVAVLEVPGVMAAALERPPAAKSHPYQETQSFKMCRIVRMRRRHIINMVSLMLRRGFPHTTEINIEILRNRAAGLLDHLETKWMGRDRLLRHAPLWDGAVFKPLPITQVSILHIRTILHTFVTSLLIPVFVLLCELIVWNTPWRHLLRQIYHPDVIKRGEGLKGPPARVVVPKLTAHLTRVSV